MKSTRILILSAFAMTLLLGALLGVSSGLLAQDKEAASKTIGDHYTCPMHPHIDELAPGSCPICGMDLLTNDEIEEMGREAAIEGGGPVYACPMHAQIVQHEPGSCPICGMDLVNEEPRAGASSKPMSTPTSQADAVAPPKDKKKGPRKVKHWVAPMDPTFISDKPGKSPMGMDLVPVYEEGSGGSTVTIDPVVVQNMGLRIKAATRETITREIRTIGTVGVAENELSVVNLRYSGWVEHIYVDETGAPVKRGQPLFSIYSPELVATQQEYILAVRSLGADSMLARSARIRLQFWNMPKGQINKIAARGKPLRAIAVGAPQAGYVLHKDIVLGAHVSAGQDVYRIGNLDKIWINADVYEFDAPWVKVGQRVKVKLSYQVGQTYEGEVSYIYPTLNPKTRTLSVRVELDNPEMKLKPGMFATVEIEAEQKLDALAIPTESILHSGTRELVFVAIALGKYEMREITTGLVGDRYLTEVLTGVREGERVVTSGQFLLDSESQLQEAVQKLLDTRLHAKEKRVAPTASEGHDHADGDTYWTCGMHPQVVQDGPGTCPICGMNLIEKKR